MRKLQRVSSLLQNQRKAIFKRTIVGVTLSRAIGFTLVIILSAPMTFGGDVPSASDDIAVIQSQLKEQREKIEVLEKQVLRRGWVSLGAGLTTMLAGGASAAVALSDEGDNSDSASPFMEVVAGAGAVTFVIFVGSLIGVSDSYWKSRSAQEEMQRLETALYRARAHAAGAPLVIEDINIQGAESNRVAVRFTNVGEGEIKYVHLVLAAYNRVYDPVGISGNVPNVVDFEVVGPIVPGESLDWDGPSGWPPSAAAYVRIEHIRITFLDETLWQNTEAQWIADHMVAVDGYDEISAKIGRQEALPAAKAVPQKELVIDEGYTTADWPRQPNENEIVRIPALVDYEGVDIENAYNLNVDAVFSIHSDKGHASGFTIAESGFALTNAHVVDGAAKLSATFRDGRSVPLRVLRTNARSDVALLQLPKGSYRTVVLVVPTDYSVGDDVIAIGTPIDESLSFSATKGIVSGERFAGDFTLIQTDASINPGNSGGPLVSNVGGNVLGIVSAKLVSELIEGIGFAISLDDAVRSVGVRLITERD